MKAGTHVERVEAAGSGTSRRARGWAAWRGRARGRAGVAARAARCAAARRAWARVGRRRVPRAGSERRRAAAVARGRARSGSRGRACAGRAALGSVREEREEGERWKGGRERKRKEKKENGKREKKRKRKREEEKERERSCCGGDCGPGRPRAAVACARGTRATEKWVGDWKSGGGTEKGFRELGFGVEDF